MNWIILIIAGLCETGFAFCLGKTKLTVGTEYWLWISGFAALYVLSAVLLAKATQTIPIGVAYPVWTGIGAVGAVQVGADHARYSVVRAAHDGEDVQMTCPFGKGA